MIAASVIASIEDGNAIEAVELGAQLAHPGFLCRRLGVGYGRADRVGKAGGNAIQNQLTQY